MIKLVNRIFEVSEETEKKIEAMQEAYDEAVSESSIIGREVPEPPVYKMELSDYKVTEQVLFVDSKEVEAITKTLEGETQIYLKSSRDFIVKESPEEVYELICQHQK